MAIRIGCVVPNLLLSGASKWLLDLAAATGPGIEWVGCTSMSGHLDSSVVTQLSKLMPVHLGATIDWFRLQAVRDRVQVHADNRSSVAAVAEDADILLTWELTTTLPRVACQVVLVSHSATWKMPVPEGWQVVAVSQAARVNFPGARVILSGVSVDRIMPRRPRKDVRWDWRCGPDDFVIGSIGRPVASKGLFAGAAALPHLPDKYRAAIVGAHDPWLSAKDRQLVNETRGRVLLFPQYDCMGDFYAAIDLLLVDSRTEAFGNVLAEAWLAGTPVLARAGVGVVPELEAQSWTMSHSYMHGLDPAGLADRIRRLAEIPDPAVVATARTVAQQQLTSAAMAARWEAYFHEIVSPRRRHVPRSRTVRVRWRDEHRPIRAVLYCANFNPQLYEQICDPRIEWVYAVATSHVTGDLPIPVITDFSGPPTCLRYQNLHRGLQVACGRADVVVTYDADDSDAALAAVTLPAVALYNPARLAQAEATRSTLYDAVRKVTTGPAGPPVSVRAFMLCPHIGFGGSEQWMRRLFKDAAGTGLSWVGCGVVKNAIPNKALADEFESLGVPLSGKFGATEIAAAISARKPDVIVFWGLDRPAACLPPDYTGPVVAMSHGVGSDDWTREWLRQSAPATTHRCAVSYLAAEAYADPEAVDVVYPGIDLCDHRAARDAIRDEQLIPRDAPVIGYVGRAESLKNPLRAAEIAAKIPGSILLCVGGDEGWRGHRPIPEALQELVAGRVRYVPYTADVPRLMAAMDVLVLRSQFESFGLVIPEALQQGCRVLGPAVSCLTDRPDLFDRRTTAAPADDRGVIRTVRGLLKEPPGELSEAAKTQLDSRMAARNFAKYLQDRVVPDKARAARTSLFLLSPAYTPPKPGQLKNVSCDAVLPAGPDPLKTARTIRALQRQLDATAVIHVVGPESQIRGLERLAEPDLHFHIRDCNTVLDAAFGLPFRTGNVLLAAPGWEPAPRWVQTAASAIERFGVEVVFHGDTNWPGTMLRRATLTDMWLTNEIPATFQALLADTRLLRIHQTLPEPTFACDPTLCRYTHVPPRPGVQLGIAAVLPFRDNFDLVRAAAESILDQDNAEVTLYLVDDCSHDWQTADAFLRGLSRGVPPALLKIFRTTRNIGQFMAANAVMHHVKEDVVLIQDGDDISLPKRAWLTAASLRKTGAALFSGAVRGFGGELRLLSSTYPHAESWYFAINPATGFTRDAFMSLGGYKDFGDAQKNKTSLDTEFFTRAYARGLPWQISAEPIVAYRQRPDSCVNSQETGLRSPARRAVEERTIRQLLTGTTVQGSVWLAKDWIKPWLT